MSRETEVNETDAIMGGKWQQDDNPDAAPDGQQAPSQEATPQEDLAAPMEYEDLAPVRVPVRIGSERYVLMDASADAEAKWRNFQIRCTKIRDNQLSGLDGIADSKIQLIHLCLAYANPDGSARMIRVSQGGGKAEEVPDLVPLSVIRRFPSRIADDLFERAKKISRLDEGAAQTPLFGGSRGNG